ncbi:MAG: fimbrillin family protein [Odoribacteraceae bacterium]|jgi:hypothetical protein|nr:fimbrillin family protein [Odoribacteraceae bacterium]
MNELFTNSYQRRARRPGALLACLVLLAACGEPPAEGPGAGIVPLKFSVEVSPVAPTKAPPISGTGFPSGVHRIGMWICQHEATPALFTPAMTGYGNLEAETIASADGSNMKYDWSFKVGGSTSYKTLGVRQGNGVDIYAYYPRVPGATNPTEIPFTSGQTDWMVATPVLGLSPAIDQAETTVNLAFEHLMTCIQVNITCRYDGDIAFSKMTLHDTEEKLYPGGKINAYTGSLVLDPATRAGTVYITPGVTLNRHITQSVYIIMPAVEWPELTEGRFTLSFVYNGTVDGEETYIIPKMTRNITNTADITIGAFEAGKCYIYNLLLDNQVHFGPMEVTTEWPTTSTDIPLVL